MYYQNIKTTRFYFIPLLIFILLVSPWETVAQKIIELRSLKNEKIIRIKKGNRIIFQFRGIQPKGTYEPLIYRNRNLAFGSGKIKEITDSTIVVKEFFQKKKSYLIDSISRIKKISMGRDILIILPLTMATYFYYDSRGYIINPVYIGLPVLIAYGIIDNSINPMKNVQEKYYKRRNRWELKVR
jgi:hypothetical protein